MAFCSFHRPLAAGAAIAAAWLFPAAAQSPAHEAMPRAELRVCGDPNNLPFSNEKGEGFENKIAAVIAADMSLPVRYFWLPQIIGFVRNGLNAKRCDLVMGTVVGDEIMQTTTPYYYTSYMFVFRTSEKLSFLNPDDPALKSLRIGVVSGTPPSDLLVRHSLMTNARPYALTVDTRYESPAHQMLSDIASGALDAGMVWGPFAGYYIRRDKLPLSMELLHSEPGMPPLAYHIAMGLRNGETDRRRRIDAAIERHRDEITGILRDYGVPLLDERGALINP
jgi:quinoprotein dehydrogenase-associated probable ABC transporter substrate-binding protein